MLALIKKLQKTGALYWNKEENDLKNLIEKTEKLTNEEIENFSKAAKQRIKDEYNWTKIINQYEEIFLK